MSIASRPKRTSTIQAIKPAPNSPKPTRAKLQSSEAPDRGSISREAPEGRSGCVEGAFSHGRSRS
jgi:hypothetical protein